MLAPVTEADFGEEAQLALNLEAARRWPASPRSCRRSGLDRGYRETGHAGRGRDRDEARSCDACTSYQRSLGLDARWLAARECRELEPGLAPRIAGGIHAPHDPQVAPRALVRALAAPSRARAADGAGRAACEAIDGDGVSGVSSSEGAIARRAAWSSRRAPGQALEGCPGAARVRCARSRARSCGCARPPGAASRARSIRTPRC